MQCQHRLLPAPLLTHGTKLLHQQQPPPLHSCCLLLPPPLQSPVLRPAGKQADSNHRVAACSAILVVPSSLPLTQCLVLYQPVYMAINYKAVNHAAISQREAGIHSPLLHCVPGMKCLQLPCQSL